MRRAVQPGPYDDCRSLGEKKHACCEEKLIFEKGIGGERGYKSDGTPFTNGPRGQMPGEHYWAMRRRIRGVMFPDACALNTDGSPARFYDFKFACPEGLPTAMKSDGTPRADSLGNPVLSSGNSTPGWTPGKNGKPGQFEKYSALGEKVGADQPPEIISNTNC